MRSKKVKIGAIFGILVLVLILCMLKCCTTQTNHNNYSILEKMKQDEKFLHSLYEAPNICSKDWVVQYREMGKTFFNYRHEGDQEDIQELLASYQDYGKEIQQIAIFIDKNNYEDAIARLKQLEKTALQNEAKLQALYEKYVLKQ